MAPVEPNAWDVVLPVLAKIGALILKLFWIIVCSCFAGCVYILAKFFD